MTLNSGMRPRRARRPVDLADGGTGKATPEEAAAALGVPSLDGNNVFSGVNEFQGTTRINGALELTLQGDDAVNIIDSAGAINVLDFSGSNGATYAFPAGGGTVQMALGAPYLPYRAISGAYTAQDSDGVINATSGTFTLALPAASGREGRVFYVKNSGAGTVTLDGDGAETIDGAGTLVVAAGTSVKVVCDGSGWVSF